MNKIKGTKPVYKKWWFWLVIILILGIYGSSGDNKPVDNAVSEPPTGASTIAPVEAVEPDIPEGSQQPDATPAAQTNGTAQTTVAAEISPSEKALYTVTKVTDGDTIQIDYNGTTEKVRLIGVDTPESVHPDAAKNTEFGKVASEFTKNNLLDKQVELEFDVSARDRYGRMLAYVWLDGIMYNEYLVEQGYAKVSTYPPDVKYVDRFTAAQEKARNANAGLWGYQEEAAEPVVAATTIQASEPPPSTAIVYITNTGEKYHRGSCRHLSKSKIEISLDAAKAQGYGPCGTCKP